MYKLGQVRCSRALRLVVQRQLKLAAGLQTSGWQHKVVAQQHGQITEGRVDCLLRGHAVSHSVDFDRRQPVGVPHLLALAVGNSQTLQALKLVKPHHRPEQPVRRAGRHLQPVGVRLHTPRAPAHRWMKKGPSQMVVLCHDRPLRVGQVHKAVVVLQRRRDRRPGKAVDQRLPRPHHRQRCPCRHCPRSLQRVVVQTKRLPETQRQRLFSPRHLCRQGRTQRDHTEQGGRLKQPVFSVEQMQAYRIVARGQTRRQHHLIGVVDQRPRWPVAGLLAVEIGTGGRQGHPLPHAVQHFPAQTQILLRRLHDKPGGVDVQPVRIFLFDAIPQQRQRCSGKRLGWRQHRVQHRSPQHRKAAHQQQRSAHTSHPIQANPPGQSHQPGQSHPRQPGRPALQHCARLGQT